MQLVSLQYNNHRDVRLITLRIKVSPMVLMFGIRQPKPHGIRYSKVNHGEYKQQKTEAKGYTRTRCFECKRDEN